MANDPHTRELIRGTISGERLALARAISWVENESEGAREVLEACFARSGRAFRVGITGPPGAGKSTLCAKMARALREAGSTVGIVAVDPTSPFSGGALLGDRVRMADLAGDEGVFIRSMASRGSLGGLAVNTSQVCDVLDAAGFDFILIETVGVGQSELEVAATADSTVVVLVPESGDGVQAMKAGLMEIGDLFVVNKADREGAERAAMAIRGALELRAPVSDWSSPVLLAAATTGQGVAEVVERAREHLRHLKESGQLAEKRRRRLSRRLEDLVRDQLWRDFAVALPPGGWDTVVTALAARRLGPYQALERILGERKAAAKVVTVGAVARPRLAEKTSRSAIARRRAVDHKPRRKPAASRPKRAARASGR